MVKRSKHLPKDFPFKEIFADFLNRYSKDYTYLYIQKARVLSPENIENLKNILEVIFENYLNSIWNVDTEDQLFKELVEKGLLEPYKKGSKFDRTALVRIVKKLIEMLGLLWIKDDDEIVITDAGLELLTTDKYIEVIEKQIAKFQYPQYEKIKSKDQISIDFYDNKDTCFQGLIPHLFILQLLQKCDYFISYTEFELFVNLAQKQEDLDKIVKFIKTWRDISDTEQSTLIEIISNDKKYKDRYTKIHQNASYQRSFFTFPHYLDLIEKKIKCKSKQTLDRVISEKIRNLKVPIFFNPEDWFSYFGDPSQEPSWFTFLSLEIERAKDLNDAKLLVNKHKEKIDKSESEEIYKKQIEKAIEDFYVSNLDFLEKGLKLVKDGRQYSTPIGRIDLFCKDTSGKYVIIEIKAKEADDSVFGQILRYIGWIHRNYDDGKNNVRGIILAEAFSDKARYSRIGLLKEDYKSFLDFKKHGLNLQNI